MHFIENGDFTIKEKQTQKCDTMNWLMQCEQPIIQRRCSQEAAGLFSESLMAATEYVAPECYPDYTRSVFAPRNTSLIGETVPDLTQKLNLTCTDDLKREIDAQLGSLAAEIRRMTRHGSIAYPMGYVFGKRQLTTRCNKYKKAMSQLSGLAKNRCLRRYPIYDQVHYAMEYPCGYATEKYFFRYFNCLSSIRYTKSIKACEKSANRQLLDASNDPCETYEILMDCMYDRVVKKCGYDGWEMEYQYLSKTVKKYVPNCSLRRLLRIVEGAHQTGNF